MGHFTDRAVAVTGAGGSIGTELCRRIVADGARRLVLISISESALYTVEKLLRREHPAIATTLVPLLASVCDRRAMEEAFDGCDVVVHAAAHKHLPLCELNPCEAIKNNVIGSLRAMQAAVTERVKQFCLISSDKAVHPTSIMGATKRLAEIICTGRAGYLCPHTAFFTVRFGNVLGSAGSVIPLWQEQIAAGGPVTVTDPRCERYFMSIPEAVGLVTAAIELRPDHGTFVLDMGEPRNLMEMAAELIRQSGREIEIKVTGLRSGEKLREELHHGGELRATQAERVSRVAEHPRVWAQIDDVEYLGTLASHRRRELAVKALWGLVA